MKSAFERWLLCVASLALAASLGLAQTVPQATGGDVKEYVLGPDDVLKIWVLGVDEIGETPIRVDSNGWISLPLVGRVQAGGLTVEELRVALVKKLQKDLRDPNVSVSITDFGSQPVAVVGAVNTPGVHQLRGRKTLAEVIALAGGLRPDAGYNIRISRPTESGTLPLPSPTLAPDGKFWVGEVKTQDFLAATNPSDNILIRPHDVITVPTADMVYVIGAVRKPGAFVLHERETMSILQALSMAEGLGPTPAPGDSRILRTEPGAPKRREIPVDVKKIMAGHAEDLALRANDILFVPPSHGKMAALRTLDAAITAGTGLLIFGR